MSNLHFADNPPLPGTLFKHVASDSGNKPMPRSENGIPDSEDFDMTLLLVLGTKQPNEGGMKHTWAITQVADRDGRICWVETSWFLPGGKVYKQIA